MRKALAAAGAFCIKKTIGQAIDSGKPVAIRRKPCQNEARSASCTKRTGRVIHNEKAAEKTCDSQAAYAIMIAEGIH